MSKKDVKYPYEEHDLDLQLAYIRLVVPNLSEINRHKYMAYLHWLKAKELEQIEKEKKECLKQS